MYKTKSENYMFFLMVRCMCVQIYQKSQRSKNQKCVSPTMIYNHIVSLNHGKTSVR